MRRERTEAGAGRDQISAETTNHISWKRDKGLSDCDVEAKHKGMREPVFPCSVDTFA